MFVRWYRKRENRDEREESLDEVWRGERSMKRGQLEREWRENGGDGQRGIRKF